MSHMHVHHHVIGISLLVTWLVPAAQAQPLEIQNPGFEAVELADDEFLAGQLGGAPGWEGTNNNAWGAWNPPVDAYPDEAPEGSNIGFLYQNPDLGSVAMSHDLSDTLQPEATYTLSLFVGNPQAYFSELYNFFFDLEGFPSYRVELLAGGVVLAADDNTLLPEEGTFERTSITYSVPSDDPLVGEPLSIRLINFNDLPGYQVDFDDVQLNFEGDPCPWDLDGNGDVGVSDFLQLLAVWGQTGVPADFDGGGVGVSDFLILLANWGPCP